jgi:protease IV
MTRADDMIDRRRLRRKLSFWRALTFVVAAAAIFALSWWGFGEGRLVSSPHIAKIKIEGTILEDEDLLNRLKRVSEADAVQGVILAINSPGGTTAGGEAIYRAVRELAEQKPVTAQVGTLATSAGYMIASATDHIVARQSSIIGSIGVLVQIPNVTGLLEKLGIEVVEVKSSPLKAEPSPFNPTTEEERAMIRALVMDSYDWFVDLVTDRRPLSRVQVRQLADGSVFTGRQALELKLVDQLGGEDEALEWLKGRGVDTELRVIEWRPRRDRSVFWLAGSQDRNFFDGLGHSLTAELLRRLGADRIFLDGLLSVWQPEKSALRD